MSSGDGKAFSNVIKMSFVDEEVGMKKNDIKIALLKYLISRSPNAIVGAEVSYLFGSLRGSI